MTNTLSIKRLKLSVTFSLLTIATILLTFHPLSTQAQILGGSGNGASTPKEVSASKVTAGGFSGDVSLFTGTYNSSYALGGVTTPDGLSFTATLSYSSSFSSGNEQPHSTGIPYGEGWNLDVPTISVSTEDYNKYTNALMENINSIPRGIASLSGGHDTLPTKTFSFEEITDEGALYWFAPTVSIPGVASGRMVFKELDNGSNPVFVLHQFERYVEARLFGNTWEVEVDDGTVYSFGLMKANYREASNQRTSLTSLGNSNIETIDGTSSAVMDLVMPKSEIVSWYITSITHPNKSGIISFKYETFGQFDYFKQYKQKWLSEAVRDYNNFIFIDTTQHVTFTEHIIGNGLNIPNGDELGIGSQTTVVTTNTTVTSQPIELIGNLGGIILTVAYKDVFLREVSTGYDKLVFDYESISTQGGAHLMDLDDPTVGRKDSLYSYQTVYKWGTSGLGFDNGWQRYHHMYSDALAESASGTPWSAVEHPRLDNKNPFKGTEQVDWGSYDSKTLYFRSDITGGEAQAMPFNHSYFESPRIGQNLPVGDIYEIKTNIRTNKYNSVNGFCNFDINIATGTQLAYGDADINDTTVTTGHFNRPLNLGSNKRPLAKTYEYSRSESLFSTFHQAIKWNPVMALSGNGVMTTSNYFTMSNLPPQFGGFNIQVGPGNSDNHYGLFEQDALTYTSSTTTGGASVTGASPRKSYYGLDAGFESELDAYIPDENGAYTTFNFLGGHWSSTSAVGKNTQIRTGDAIPNNFGIGMPWRMLADMYSQHDEYAHPKTTGAYFNFWFNRNQLYPNNQMMTHLNGGNWMHANVPTLADNDMILEQVELVRYTKNPYMLRHVKYYRMSYENASTAINTGNQDLFWELVSHTEFNYDIQTMGNYALVLQRSNTATNANQYEWWLYPNGERNMFLLSNIKEVPIDGSTYSEATLPTTHFEYDTTTFIDPSLFTDAYTGGFPILYGKNLGSTTEEPHNKNYAILTKITNPLGGETTIEYDYTARYVTSYQSSKVLNAPKYYPPHRQPDFKDIYPKFKRVTSFALQTNLVVKSKTLKDRNGTTKKWDYVFQDRKGMSNEMPLTPEFKENTNPFAYSFNETYSIYNNVSINRSKGFGTTIVYQPELSSTNRPYIKYYHTNTHSGTDASTYLLWGKLYKVENYDGQDNLMSETDIEYDSKLAFESGYLRGYCDFDGGECSLDGATVWDYAEGIHAFSASQSHVGVADFHGIYGDARSYESKMAQYIESVRPNFLNSFFVYKKREINTAYDRSCADCTGEGGTIPSEGGDDETGNISSICYESIQTITDYEYYDADKEGISQTQNYKAFTQITSDEVPLTNCATPNDEVQLLYEPSWQLAQKKTYSPQLPDAYSQEDYFYYYDMANDIGSLGSDWQIENNFHLLQDIRAKKMRNIVSEHRVTSKAPGQAPQTQTNYYLYERDWQDDATGSIYTMNNAFVMDSLHAPNYPCTNTTEPQFPQDCFLTNDPIAGDDTGSGTGGIGTGTPSDPIEVEMDNSWMYTAAVTGQTGGGGGGGGGSSDTIHYCLYDSIPQGMVYCPCEPEIYVDPAAPLERQDIGSLLESKIWFRSTMTYTQATVADPDVGMHYMYTGINEFTPNIQTSNVDPKDYIETYRVEERTPYGWVYREKDVKGMITRYDYVPTDIIEYHYCNIFGRDAMKYFYGNTNFGKVASVTVAEGTPEELVSHYTYNPSGTIASVLDPNGITLSYNYDEYNRMTKAYRNSQLLAESNYSRWDNDAGLTSPTTFEQRTIQNYVETITHNDLTGTNFAKARAFVDPLGRNALSAASVSNNPDRLIVSAYTQYDTWDRAIHNYKPTIYQAATGTGMSNLDYHSAMNNTNLATAPKTTQQYTADPRSRVVKAAKYGIDITSNHVVETDFCLVDGDDLLTELGVSATTMSGWVQNTSSSYQRSLNIFLKTTIEDEDDKQVIEYGNAIGQKIATLRYDDAGQKVLTLFFYDSRGNLIEVINPENQSSRYLYNDLGQLYEKQTLDGGYTRYIYNQAGQLVMEQDANGAANGYPYVRAYSYDIMGRMTAQDRIGCSADPFVSFSATNSLSWKNSTLGTNYISGIVPEKRWNYGLSFNTNDSKIIAEAKDYLNHSLTGTKGQLTRTISYDHLGTPIEYRFFSYNSEGLPKWEITQFNQNGIAASQPGLMVRIDFAEYSLQGNLLTQNIDLDGNRTFDFQYHYTYDDWSRLKEIFISYDNQKANGYKVAAYQYDDALGLVQQLTYYDSKSNTCKNYPVDQITYTYDIRDRLTELQSNLFDWRLYYDGNSPSIALAQQNWNGNINGTQADYKFGTSGLNITNLSGVSNFTNDKYTDYVYTYDKLNRLTNADAAMHNGSLVNNGIGDATYSYDKIGNLLSLIRTDFSQTTTYNYNYQAVTNKMTGVIASVGLSVVGNYTYNYDNNGNLTYDSKRDVTVTKYGRANLPATLSTTNHNLTYLYDVADLRIYKNQADKGRGGVRSAEWYLRAGGKEIAVYDMNRGELTWYIHGSKRIAKLKHQLNDGTETPDIIGGTFTDDTETYEIEDEERRGEVEELLRHDSEGEAYLNLPDKLLYVEYSDGTKEYILESRVGGNYTILSSVDLVDESQQLVFTTADGEIQTISLEELVGLLEDVPDGSSFGGYDPFIIPMSVPSNAPTPDLVYYIYDHLGNTRVTYSTTVECDASVAYTLEAVVDYYPYGKELRSYYGEEQEKYLTTQHERDVETGLDYRGARFYDSDIARFLSLDPLAQDYPSFSDYVYVANNPVSFVDPDGRKVEPPADEDDNGPSKQAFNNLKAAYLAASKNEELDQTDRTRYRKRYDDLVRMEKATDIVYVIDITGYDKMPSASFDGFVGASTDKTLNTSSNSCYAKIIKSSLKKLDLRDG